jgi:hypothetical protein
MRKFLALAAMLAAATTPAFAEVVDFEGAEIVIGAPDGYCEVGSGEMSGRLLTDDPGDILIAFARCEEVEALSGANEALRHYGLFVGLRDAEGEAIRPESLESYLAAYDSEQFDIMGAGNRRAMVGLHADQSVEIQPIGPVATREQAHYVALALRPDDPGRTAMVAVAGRTVIAGRAVQLELYAPEEKSPIPVLLDQSFGVMGLLWENNAATAGVGASSQEAAGDASEEEGGGMAVEGEEGASEEEALGAESDMAEPEEQLDAVLHALDGEFAAILQGAYWTLFGYFAASVLIGAAIFGYFKLQPRRD